MRYCKWCLDKEPSQITRTEDGLRFYTPSHCVVKGGHEWVGRPITTCIKCKLPYTSYDNDGNTCKTCKSGQEIIDRLID